MGTSTRPDDGSRGRLWSVAFDTPYGAGRLTLLDDLPYDLQWPGAAAGRRPAAETEAPSAKAADAAARWVELLERYFEGEVVEFPLDIARYCEAHGCTRFERDVYAALHRAPYGTAVSYRDLAVAAGHPAAWRAAGSVMARNELPIILPCHRVIRSDGSLGSYGDDPLWKERLLRLEGALGPRSKGRA